MEFETGYIYVLFNPSLPNLVKIGKTSREPEDRAKELSAATGVPTPFVVVYQAYFQDISKAEKYIHSLLDKKKVSDNKEFFQLSTTEAINSVIKAEEYFKQVQNETERVYSKIEDESATQSDNPIKEIWAEILEKADAYYFGTDDEILEDFEKAQELYLQAGKLGCGEAYRKLGDAYYNGDYAYIGPKEDKKKALHFYQLGVENGDENSWGDLGIIYFELEQWGNADKCFLKYITNVIFQKKSPMDNLTNMRVIEAFVKFMDRTRFYNHPEILESFYSMAKSKGM